MSEEMKFRKKPSREQFWVFVAAHPAALVVLEACGSANYWAREVEAFGHEGQLIAPHACVPLSIAKKVMRLTQRRS